MLASFLKTVGDKYEITFQTDSFHRLMFIRIQKGLICKETFIKYENLSDELCVVKAIRDAIIELEAMRDDRK